jgi:hypothetical protein
MPVGPIDVEEPTDDEIFQQELEREERQRQEKETLVGNDTE